MRGWQACNPHLGSVPLYVAAPDTQHTVPGVVVIQHAAGVDDFVQDCVHKLADHGFAAAAPALFHRQDPNLNPTSRIRELKDVQVESDISAAATHLRRLEQPRVRSVSLVGFCMGGRVAYRLACQWPELAAAAIFYGGNILTSWGRGPTPLDLTEGIECPLVGFFGNEDKNPSPADVDKIERELTRYKKRYEFHRYDGAGHAFLNFADPLRHREAAAAHAWENLLRFLGEHTGASGEASARPHGSTPE